MFQNPLKKLDHDNLKRSSDLLKQQRDDNKIINGRLKIMAFIVCIIFTAISARIIYIQLNKNDEYKIKLENYVSKKQSTTTPRGTFLDSKMKTVVNTTQSLNLTYYPPENISSQEEWDLAIRFTKQFGISEYKATDEELKKLYLMFSKDKDGNLDHGNHLLSKANYKKIYSGKLSNEEADKLRMKEVKESHIKSLDQDILDAYGNWLLMNAGQGNNRKIVLENVNTKQASYFIEHKDDFSGFDLTSGWSREYPFGNTFMDVFGKISAIPSDQQLYYQAKNYALNEKVGTSGLEKQYEDLLSGSRVSHEIKYDSNGKAVFNEVTPGKKGYDLQLTIDMDLQQKIDKIVSDTLVEGKSNPLRKYFNKLFVVLMNPKDGSVYAMSGMGLNSEGNLYEYASGNYLDAQTPGSIVKGATVFMGLNEKVVKPGELINDAPMYFKGTPPKHSYRDYGPLDQLGALEKSSNVYMFNVAIRLAKGTYIPNGPLNLDIEYAFPLMRYYYSMFGLGTTTGIDIPNEQTGFKGYDKKAGLLLDFAIGQYDTYTPIQMVQYVSTIANNGYRVKPRLVKGAYEVNNHSSFIFENKAEVLSKVQGDSDLLKYSQEGFRACVTSGMCGVVKNNPHNVAAKTGTAETFIGNIPTSGASLIGYAPYENPEVAFACVAPNSSYTNDLQPNVCSNVVMGKVLDEYFNSKNKK
ncbi:MAG: penicillin-binding protein 2 [Erysipelotrichaceae bacterium]